MTKRRPVALVLVSLGLALPAPATEPEPDCSRPAEARAHIARLSLAELEYAEDVHREAHWEALGRCALAPEPSTCRASETRRFDALWRERRAAIEARYRRLLEDYTARCSASVTRRRGQDPRRRARRGVTAPRRSSRRAPS
jgi:hypothetical protein